MSRFICGPFTVILLIEELEAIATRRASIIFVADDTRDIRELVSFVLRRDGFEVVTFVNGAELLEAALRTPPEAIVLDIAMPIMDGLETLRRLVAAPSLSRVPVMMLTSNSQAENVQRALSSGARDFVVKPFESDMLRQRVRRLLELPKPVPVAEAPVSIVTPVVVLEVPTFRLTPVILVVDDQVAITEIAADFLGDRFEVSPSLGGAAALNAALQLRPELILLDLFMPVISGVEALQRLRAMREFADTPVLAMTLGTPDEEKLLVGFDGSVRKPLERGMLLRSVGAALRAPGLFSFTSTETAVVLKFHRARIWEEVENDAHVAETTGETQAPARFWDAEIVAMLTADCERAFASMLEGGKLLFVVDLERLTDLPNYQLGAIVSVTRGVIARARECRLMVRMAVPQSLQPQFAVVANEFRVGMYLRLWETMRDVRPGRR